jgi:hypothetical protein
MWLYELKFEVMALFGARKSGADGTNVDAELRKLGVTSGKR